MVTYNVTTHAESVSSTPVSEDSLPEKYIWQPRPINIWVGMNPSNYLQLHVLRSIQQRLRSQGCNFVQVPGEKTELGAVVHLGIGFGANLREEIRPSAVYGRLTKPRGTVLTITAVESIPDTDLFELARGQLVKKACHLGILVEGDLDGTRVKRALWASMAGNHSLITGREEDILNNLALRVQAHAGADKINKFAGEDETSMSWDDWSQSPVHRDIAQAGRALGAAGIIEDKVILDQYGTDRQARDVLRFLERGALGEGMRSQLDPTLRVMAVTSTGGGKINVSPDPTAGQIIPISQLTWDGYVRALPRGCPITFNDPSIETHENGLVYLAGALINAGLIDSLDGFMSFLKSHFAEHDRIDVLPVGLEAKVTAMEHFHRQPKTGSLKDPAMVELVYPNEERFPPIDFPCGVRPAELQLLSAVFRSQTFKQPGPLEKAVIAILPGHGSVALYGGGPREELTDVLISGMEMELPIRV